MKTIWSWMLGLALAGATEAQVLPPDASVDGKTLGEWHAEFWKWITPIPTNQNPALDPDGQWAHVAQPEGSVFFLPKGYNITRVGARAFSVREGKYFFAPLMSVQQDNVGVVPPLNVEQLR